MCDTNNQLPNSVSGFAISNVPTGGMAYCGACAFWYVGPHHCRTNFGYETPLAPSPDTYAAKVALHKLADELARLTTDVPNEKQAGVWAAYYELQGALK